MQVVSNAVYNANNQPANSVRVAWYSSQTDCQNNVQSASSLVFMAQFLENVCEPYGEYVNRLLVL